MLRFSGLSCGLGHCSLSFRLGLCLLERSGLLSGCFELPLKLTFTIIAPKGQDKEARISEENAGAHRSLP